ncbi:MAG: 50S ribosomal protein L1 [Candidatus Sulcia muelleri]|uniref:Large ribosomal subunit protein uL1 n=2 Tax=Candidatus Karelsulcia muelleri TaxID=336810 RepID=A8Z5T6_KARMG|nr:50S ribosomal subunit protein L1 [Candidatus Karelsulcia muelleri GWSS]AIN47628.1 LSU ribosomal protein L1p (L10Ae) [Candidatus Karelsulcia muelleri]EAT14117.1 50S ribosomal protein L1 [Candidatus Karelsulcia muelleri str. Hc (Homalodisca coagulata)]MCJ7422631.1 50S ribosomal protein L1 [Candidatus Karelsulcia muelleri]MCJ7468748.1 50S ribosomal protein L1 [Candidatus Karelsulcia muelleri]
MKKIYSLNEASKIVTQQIITKFDSTVDIAICLGIDPKIQFIRGTVNLPYGTGKNIRVLALIPKEREKEIKNSGADFIGLNKYINKIKNGWLKFDVIVTIPSVMIKLGELGKILGPRGLMPNPKTGTVTQNPNRSIREIKSGKIEFKMDKYGIIHTAIGKVSFGFEKIKKNILELINVLNKLKPPTSKGVFIKRIYISSTMGPSLSVNTQDL